ncbi:hypothetical protein HWV62_8411 [Athelia sp. TMB]|nr:hypothetical protein HWV62_8411 [Athelia sp. TMB]
MDIPVLTEGGNECYARDYDNIVVSAPQDESTVDLPFDKRRQGKRTNQKHTHYKKIGKHNSPFLAGLNGRFAWVSYKRQVGMWAFRVDKNSPVEISPYGKDILRGMISGEVGQPAMSSNLRRTRRGRLIWTESPVPNSLGQSISACDT